MNEEATHSTSWKRWLIFLLLALLIHLILFSIPWNKLIPSISPAPRVELQEISPEKINQVRKKWRERQLLLSKSAALSKDPLIPENARYFSDRNIRVEKEQRAQNSQLIPKPGSSVEKISKPQKSQSNQKVETRNQSFPKPNLANLGIPFHFEKIRNRSMADSFPNIQNASHRDGSEGGDQSIFQRDLPIGSENLLNAQESVFYSFYARLYEAIVPVWQSQLRNIPSLTRSLASGDYTTVVDVTLDNLGNLREIRRLESSGISEFDLIVDRSWERIRNFPNPPQGLLDKKKEVHIGWRFTVRVDQNTGLQLFQPSRTY